MKKEFTIGAIVKKFPQKGGWVYVPIPQTYKDFGGKPKWGLIPATITLGKTTWKRSLLPFGDGTLFIALSEKIRKAEKITVGDTITISFKV
jgi:hypothetical protein